MMADCGISYEGDVLDLALAQKVVVRSGAWFKYGDAYLGQGKEKARAFLVDARTFALAETLNFREWSGYYAVSAYEPHHEHEYNAIRNAAALIDITPLFKYMVTGKDATRLVNRVIKESVESAERAKQQMADNIVDYTRQTLQEGETQLDETVKATLGSLAEEASSELVQKELEAMSKAVTDAAGAAIHKATSLTSTISNLVQEFAHIDLSRDTKKEDLNAFLARLPKTNDVKG